MQEPAIVADRADEAEIDRLIDAHLGAEAAGDIPAILAILSEEVDHEPAPDPRAPRSTGTVRSRAFIATCSKA